MGYPAKDLSRYCGKPTSFNSGNGQSLKSETHAVVHIHTLMATLRQYYETDLAQALKIHVTHRYGDDDIAGTLNIDIPAHASYSSWYFPQKGRNHDYFLGFLQSLQYGSAVFQSAPPGIRLPSAKLCASDFRIDNGQQLVIEYRMFGESTWRPAASITATRRVFLYSDDDMDAESIAKLQASGEAIGHFVQFRGRAYAQRMDSMSKPIAFISHDSRDKEIARAVAINLQSRRCSVWYDEFSLMVGSNLRDSIEKGLKECKKCILVLSPNFFANAGWTKKEFDSIFTREIIEEQSLVLPIWSGVSKHEVFNYSPSLVNVLGLDWNTLGEEEVCRRLHLALDAI
jgi:hypothetical protein